MNAIKEAHYNLGIAYLESGQYSRAVPEFESAIRLDPNFIGAYCALCRAYLQQDELENAGIAITEALKLDANHQPALLLCGMITDAYYDRGKTYLDDRSYTEAVAAFQEAVVLDADLEDSSQEAASGKTHIHVHLGYAYIGMKAYPQAIVALEHALRQDADLVDAHYHLGYAYVEQGEPDKAISHLERAIVIAPHFKRAHYHLARAYRALGNFEAATHAVTETLRLDPNYQPAHELADKIKQAHYNRGITYLNGERYSEAVTAFQNAITLDSDFVTAHYNLGLAYLKMEAYRRAIPSLEKTVALDPNHKAAHHSLALAYLGHQELGKARDAARTTLKIDADYQPALSLLEAVDPSFIAPETHGTAQPDPKSPINPQPEAKSTQEMHYDLGVAYLESEMYAEAIIEFRKAIDLDSDFVAPHVGLGTVYLEMGQLDDAENAAREALRIDANTDAARQLLDDIKQARPEPPRPEPAKQTPPVPDTTDVQQDLARGLAFLNSRQYEQAAAAFKRVIKADPDSMEAHYGLGQAYLEIGAFDDAKTAAEAALSFDPNSHKARELLQMIAYARNIEKNKRIRKKILSYVAVIGIFVVAAFIAIGLGVIPLPFSSGPPVLSIVASLEEPSKNGFLDAGETGNVRLTFTNTGSAVQNVEVRFDPSFIAGLRIKTPAPISRLAGNSEKIIRIPITANKNVKGRSQQLQFQLFGKTGFFSKTELLATKNFSFKIIPDAPDPIPPRRR